MRDTGTTLLFAMMRGILTLLTFISTVLFPWPLTVLLALAVSLFEPLVPLAAGLFADTLYYAPQSGTAPIFTLRGAGDRRRPLRAEPAKDEYHQRMKWRRMRSRDPEIAPDEIFLDASNAPAFDRARFEGRIEKPLSHGTFLYLAAALALLFFVLATRTWNLQITNGAAFAEESAHNSLDVTTLFAPRGIIVDVNGVVVAENVAEEDGSVRRNYPVPSLGQIIGYVSYPKKDAKGIYYDTSQTGIAGLEAEYDSFLAGKNGRLLTERDALGRVRSEGTIVKADEGRTVRLSIDANLERLLARAIIDTASSQRFIAGAGVIMDVSSGAVRAIVSYPSYDPNVMSNGGPSDTIARYAENPGQPFLDHAVQGVYAPGSIVKPLIAAGALTDGIITPSTVINDKGFISLPDPYHPGKSFIYRGWRARPGGCEEGDSVVLGYLFLYGRRRFRKSERPRH